MLMIPYVQFDGQCREAFDAYASLFGGTVGMAMTYADAPIETHAVPGTEGRIMHAVLKFGTMTLMGCDTMPGCLPPERAYSLSLHPADIAEAERLYAALSEGGTVRMALQETFWAHRFGTVTDRFGIPWMVSCDKPG